MTSQLHKTSEELGLLQVVSPFITFSDCEGGGETFEVKSTIKGFFKKTAYLTVSGQVDEETATVRMLCPTYIFGPSFRSDPSSTRFHACEFWHYEPEVPFITLSDLMTLEEETVKRIIKGLLKTHQPLIGELHRAFTRMGPKGPDVITIEKLEKIRDEPFERLSYTDAIKKLIKALLESKLKFEVPPYWGMDLGKEHELYLSKDHPVFVHDFPSELKSFYMYQNEPFIDPEIDPAKKIIYLPGC